MKKLWTFLICLAISLPTMVLKEKGIISGDLRTLIIVTMLLVVAIIGVVDFYKDESP